MENYLWETIFPLTNALQARIITFSGIFLPTQGQVGVGNRSPLALQGLCCPVQHMQWYIWAIQNGINFKELAKTYEFGLASS